MPFLLRFREIAVLRNVIDKQLHQRKCQSIRAEASGVERRKQYSAKRPANLSTQSYTSACVEAVR